MIEESIVILPSYTYYTVSTLHVQLTSSQEREREREREREAEQREAEQRELNLISPLFPAKADLEVFC